MSRKKKSYNDGCLFQTPNGKWRAVLDLGRDEKGKRIRKQVYYGYSKQEAIEVLQQSSEKKNKFNKNIINKKQQIIVTSVYIKFHF